MSTSQWLRTLIVCSTVLLVSIIVLGAFWLASFAGEVILLLLLAGLFAIMLMPLVDLLESSRRIPRPVAILVAYLCVFVVLGGIMYVVIPPLLQQANQLVQNLPDIVQNLVGPTSVVNDALQRFGIGAGTISGNVGDQLQNLAKAALSNVATVLRDIGTFAVGVVVVAVIAFYLLNEGHDFRAKLHRVVPEEHRHTVAFLQESIVNAVGGYVRAQLTVAFMVGILAGFAAWAIGVRFPLIIGALAGLFELVPFFGPTLGAVPALTIAIFQGSWLRVALILGAFIVIQQIESNLIGPRIMAHGVGLHPLVVIVVVLVGIQVAGIWGALFAVPATAVLVSVGRHIYIERSRPHPIEDAA
jgi:predicted PurR-regulated permease PerM